MADTSTKPPRSAERAAAIIDRAARMKANQPSVLDKRLGDKQMRTPGYVDPPFHNKRLAPDALKFAGNMDVPLDQIRTGQATISVGAVKSKIANPTDGKLPQLIRHEGVYYVNDGNHRVTAARAMRSGTVRAAVADLHAPDYKVGGAKSTALGAAGVAASAVSIAATSVNAYTDAKGKGAGTMEAIGKGAAAGGVVATAPVAFGAGIGAASKAAGLPARAALQVAGKAALPLTMAGTAAYYGWQAHKAGKGPMAVAGAAAWGAVNGAVPVDLAVSAYQGLKDTGTNAPAVPGRITADQAREFEAASAKREASPQAPAAPRERAGEMIEVTNQHGTTFMRRNPRYGRTKD